VGCSRSRGHRTREGEVDETDDEGVVQGLAVGLPRVAFRLPASI
jgi:hypothetical protein